ncbi:RidA family protein [Actinomadura chibensis]|uniref:RidA family protein n=1 Tax=Actinomadura chibensis TaxID=392828 RepID=A0A5D0NBY9_9ACTN|nr:RidA family protein [Actinomadura chibensis]TYB41856.1 RidA family protein [Actinomadura chibensis]
MSTEPPLTTELLRRRAAAQGVELPSPPEPKGSYRPAVVHRGTVYTSGVGPMLRGQRLHSGYVGGDVTVEQAQEAAAVAAVNALTAACAAVGGVESIERLVKLTAFVRSAPGFTRQSAVIDRASSVLHELLGERGRHARSAVGVAELPFGICVEIELLAACRAVPDSAATSQRAR